jgi:hypothetical protein
LALIATPGDVVPYPYLDTLKLFPRDYFWMFISIPMILTYVVLVTAINSSINNRNKIFSQIGVTFAIISASIILLDYFVQFVADPIQSIRHIYCNGGIGLHYHGLIIPVDCPGVRQKPFGIRNQVDICGFIFCHGVFVYNGFY